MRDMTFQIEKMKVLRENTVTSKGKPAQVMLGLCDVMLEMLAEMQGNFLLATEPPERESPPDRPIRHPLSIEDRRNEVVAMLRVCRNELNCSPIFPSLDQTEIKLSLDLDNKKTITRNAGFLIQRILETIAINK